MNKKIIIIIGLVSILFFVILIRKARNNSENVLNNSVNDENKIKVSNVVKNEITGEYVVYDENTGEEIGRGLDETSMYIYQIDPDYNPENIYPYTDIAETSENTGTIEY